MDNKNKQNLTKKEIQNKLKGFKRMDNIKELKVGMHIRYFNKTKDTAIFRLGGILTFIDPKGQFLGCINMVNKNKKWWVQLKKPEQKCIIFYKDLLKQKKDDKLLTIKIKNILEKLDNNINYINDALDLLGGAKNPEKINKNLDIIFNTYGGHIENVFKEIYVLKQENAKLKNDGKMREHGPSGNVISITY